MIFSLNSIENIFSSVKRMESMSTNVPMTVQGAKTNPVNSSSYHIPALEDSANKQNVFMFGRDKWGVSKQIVGE